MYSSVLRLYFSCVSSNFTGNSARFKPANQGTLTILGLHLTMLPFKMMSFFTDKKEVQRSATALGYAGHVRSTLSLLDTNY